MSSKAYRIPSASDRLRKHSLNLKQLEALIRLRDTARPVLPTKFSGGSPAGATGGGTGNFLPTEGGTMIGNIAFNPKLIAVVDGRVDLDPGSNDPKNSSNILVTGQGSPDDIRFIDGAERDGQILFYQGTNQQIQNILNANLLSISNIVGDGSTTVTVTLSDTGTLANGSSINVIGTDNFDINNAIIADLIVDTSFTYERAAGASTTPESLATIQDGNILINDGNTLVLDGTESLNGVPQMILKFDVTAPGGAWRVIASSGGGLQFPIDFPEEPDRGTVVTDQIIDFAQSDRHSISMTVGVATISLDIQNEPTDKLALSSITMKQDNVGGRTFTFLDTVANSQTVIDAFNALGPDESISFMLEWERGLFTVYLKTGNIVTGGGGLSEPVELGFNEVVTETPPTLTVIAGDIFNPSRVNLDQDIELQLDVSATTDKYKSIFVIFDTTGGGFTVTWPASVVNPPVIDDSVAQRISVILYTLDNGTLWTHATSVGSSTGAEFFGPWTANHDAGLQDLTNLGNIDFNDALSTIFGLVDLQWFQAGHQFTSVSGALNYRVDTTDSHNFFTGANQILEINDATGLTIIGTHVLNMGNNIINSISELQLSNANLHTPSNELSIAFDAGDDALKYAVALTTDSHRFYANTDLLATISRTGTNQGLVSARSFVASDISDQAGSLLQTNGQLFISDSTTDPTVNGEFRRNGADVKVFTGDALLNFSDIGSPSAIIDGNSSATILDAAPSFVVVLNGVQKYSISNTRVDYDDLDLFGINQINMTDPSSNDISSLTASASGLLLNILSTDDFYDIQFNSADAFHIDELRTRILSTTPNTTAPELSLFRDDASPVNDDELGLVKFDGRNSAAEFITYAEISTTIESVTDGSESANLFVNIKQNGFDVDMLRIVDGSMILRTFDPGAGVGANYTLLKEDASPGNGDLIGNVNWNVLDSPTELTYARMQVFIQEATDAALWKIQLRSDGTLQDAFIIEANDSNSQFQFLLSSNGNTRIQPLGSTRAAYFVTPQTTDFLTVLGTSGTLEFPRINDGNPSVNDLNSAAGAFDTSLVVHDINDGTLYVKNSNTQWDFYTRSGTVV